MTALHTSQSLCQLVTVHKFDSWSLERFSMHLTGEYRNAWNGRSHVTAVCLFLLPLAFNSRLAPSHGGGVGGCEQQSVSRAVTVLKMTDWGILFPSSLAWSPRQLSQTSFSKTPNCSLEYPPFKGGNRHLWLTVFVFSHCELDKASSFLPLLW